MIKFLMRRSIYKRYDRESQDMLLALDAKLDIIRFLCFMFWAVIYVFPFIPLFIMDICEDIEVSMTTQIAILVFTLFWSGGIIVLFKVFKRAMLTFSLLLAERIYFLVCTKKGKALSNNDLKVINKANEQLYYSIATQMCRGHCYSICFEICKALKKGSIEFLAIKKFSPPADEEDDGKEFTIHVLYLQDGWAFDTYSSCQYPIEKLHEIYKAKIYKVFSFEEISSKSYEEFREEQKPKLEEWCIANNCSVFSKEG